MFGFLGRSQVDRNSASTPQKQVDGQLSETDGESGTEKQVKHANRNEDSALEGYVSDQSVRLRRNSRKSRNSFLVSLSYVVLY